MQSSTPIPYNHLFSPLLEGIFRALKICYEMDKGINVKDRKKKAKELYPIYLEDIDKQNRKKSRKLEPIALEEYLKRSGKLQENNPLLINCFRYFANNYNAGFNKHIYEGLLNSHQEDGRFPRLVKLTIEAYKNSQRVNRKRESTLKALPSPLYILYYALMVPEEPQSSAYAWATCRSMLFRFIATHPENELLKFFRAGNSEREYSSFNENDIQTSMSSFRKYAQIYLRWPRDEDESDVNTLVGNILALKGIVHLWFRTEQDLLQFISIREDSKIEDYASKFANKNLKFRLSYYYTDLPDSGEIVNFLFGVPIPVRGADIVLNGALKKSSNSGLVISLSGEPGVGKTSAALSLGLLFYPFGTQCIYISLEEGARDLEKRLLTLVPDYIKEIMFFKGKRPFRKQEFINEWFEVYKLKENLTLEEFKLLFQKLKQDANGKEIEINYLPAINPLYIVIDNVNELFAEYKESHEQFAQLEKFVDSCRDLGAIVVLISAEEVHKNVKLEYLVDLAMKLKHSATEKVEEKPVRILQLTKTRHQASRPGSHVFHLSGTSGFRIAPQIPSQMDKKEKLRKLSPDESKVVHTLNFIEHIEEKNRKGESVDRLDSFEFLLRKKRRLLEKINQDDSKKASEDYQKQLNQIKNNISEIENCQKENKYFLKLFPNTQILIHGYGSSGKAGFALKLLLTPPIDKENNVRDYSDFSFRRKVLIISFLYSEDYYDDLIRNKISPVIITEFNGIPKAKHYTKTFYPGYLRPEDLINKITRLLDGAILEGEPYTGILLDGLHNVFLQFKELQRNDMVWPLLYSILSRYELTVVSTFTNFSLTDRLIDGESQGRVTQFNQSLPDHVLLQQGQTPFLHGLVKASDYYFQLSEEVSKNNTRKYLLSVKSSIKQTPPRYLLEWDRENAVFKDIHLPEDIYHPEKSAF